MIILCCIILVIILALPSYSIVKDLLSANSSKFENFKPLSDADFIFKTIEPGKKFKASKQEIINMFGKPNKIYDRAESISDTTYIYRVYTYDFFKVQTYIYDDTELEQYIEIFKKGPTTARGITVGDPENLIKTKYGPFEKYNDSYYFFKGNRGGIKYYINNQQVEKIYIFSGYMEFEYKWDNESE
jgi:hypothetical protein